MTYMPKNKHDACKFDCDLLQVWSVCGRESTLHVLLSAVLDRFVVTPAVSHSHNMDSSLEHLPFKMSIARANSTSGGVDTQFSMVNMKWCLRLRTSK